jgi:hypothetical protein
MHISQELLLLNHLCGYHKLLLVNYLYDTINNIKNQTPKESIGADFLLRIHSHRLSKRHGIGITSLYKKYR